MSGRGYAFWCEVVAEGPVYGTGRDVRFLLGNYGTVSPVLALRWLEGQALRLADRLDPDPRRAAWVRPWMATDRPPPLRDAQPLRTWCRSAAAQREARERIKSGRPLFLTATEEDCAYALSIWPVALPQADPALYGRVRRPGSHRRARTRARPVRAGRLASSVLVAWVCAALLMVCVVIGVRR